MFPLLLLLSCVFLSFPQILILSTERNEGTFSIKEFGEGVCFSGREDREGMGYDALIGVCEDGCKVYAIGSKGDDFSYTIERSNYGCIAGLTVMVDSKMSIAIVSLKDSGPKVLLALKGNSGAMLWYVRRSSDGYLLVGGVHDEDWDTLVVKLDKNLKLLWSKRIGTEAEEYAYGVVEFKGRYYIVGRSNARGNWDAFVLELGKDGELFSSKLFGSERKDYLRYVGIYRDRVLAIGRTEALGNSDILLLFPESGEYHVYDGGDFDYGRVFQEIKGGLVLMGDTYNDGDSDGMVLFLDRDMKVLKGYAVGGEGVDSIRYLDGNFFAGYTYSITLDNDMMIGRLTGDCPAFVKKKEFREIHPLLKFYPYKVKSEGYDLVPFNPSLTVREVNLERIDPCSFRSKRSP